MGRESCGMLLSAVHHRARGGEAPPDHGGRCHPRRGQALLSFASSAPRALFKPINGAVAAFAAALLFVILCVRALSPLSIALCSPEHHPSVILSAFPHCHP